MRNDPPNVATVAAVLARNLAWDVRPHLIAREAATLCNAGRALRKIAENQCNGWPRARADGQGSETDETWRARDEKRRTRLEAGALATVATLCGGGNPECPRVEFSRDPRGPALRLVYENGSQSIAAE